MNPGQDLNYHAETHLSDIVIYHQTRTPPMIRSKLTNLPDTSPPPCTHAPPMHGPACPSSQTPILPQLKMPYRDYLILLLYETKIKTGLNHSYFSIAHQCVYEQNKSNCFRQGMGPPHLQFIVKCKR